MWTQMILYMKLFKTKIDTCKFLLILSISCNLFFISVIYIAESKSHIFEQALVKRGIIKENIEDKLLPDYWARVGWTNTIDKLHIDFDVAFFGNSITRGSDFQLAFPDKKIINLGYSGDNILGMIKRVPMIKKSKAKKVFIMAGTNDLLYISLEQYETNYTKMIFTIKESLPDIKIYIQSILPCNHEMSTSSASNEKIQKANKIAERIAKEHNCTYIDLYSLYVDKNNELPKEFTMDGVHLYPDKYEKWADKIKGLIYE